MHVWTIVAGHTCATASASPVSPSRTRMQQSCVPRFLISVSTCSQYLAPCPPSPAHRGEDVAFAVYGDRERDVDGPVGDLPVTDLDADRVDKNHRIDRVQRTVVPLGHAVQHGVGDRGDHLVGHLRAIDFLKMRGHLAGGYTAWRTTRSPSLRSRPAGVGVCATILGSNVDCRSLGTLMSIGPFLSCS
jgi:hypothetical protein